MLEILPHAVSSVPASYTLPVSHLHRPDAPRPESRTHVRDALVFARLGGAEAIAYFEASDQQGAAESLLHSYPVPPGEQKSEELRQRGLECTAALPEQGYPGFTSSVRVATWLGYLFLTAVVLAAGWAVVALFGGDPEADPVLLPAGLLFLPVEEILLLAPFPLIILYIPSHLAVLRKERITARAVLRWAAGEESTRKLGIPAKSPFVGIAATWEGLQFCAGAVVLMNAFLTVFLFAVRRPEDPYAVFLLPALCALPFLVTYLFCGGRAHAAKRRHALVADRLYRVPVDEEVSLPSSISLEGLCYPDDAWEVPAPEAEGDRAPVVAALEETTWTSDFSASAAPSDHLVDPDRRER